ncbi:MAG: glycosyltransferase family 1 protein [Verrucomicrobia bacterium]|nr:glycosyltransferase family 1 protein [Verrucomicrobiota bacterium]
MARIVLVTFGSLGDLHPAIALALGLQQRGHRAEIATNEFYRAKITALGLPFHPLRPDLSLSDEAMVRRIMDGSGGSEYLMRELVFPSVRGMYADLAAVATTADLLVTGELVCAAPLLAEKTGVNWVFQALSPISFFSVSDPPLLPGPSGTRFLQSLGPAANRCIYATAKLVSHSWSAPVRALRRELALPPGGSPLFEGKYSPRLNLALFSAVLQPPQPDWPANTVQTGFLFHDEGESAPALPIAVEDFLAAGEPPIVFTLGSAAVSLARDFYAQGARAAESLGRRALLLLGKNPPPPSLPRSILAWDYLPYARVFPRAAAIVHQGGVGTTAHALRAGRPMLVVPFAHDQFDNAARVVRLGVARTLARSRCQAARLASELAALSGDPRHARVAGELGAQVRAENGVARACDALERRLR